MPAETQSVKADHDETPTDPAAKNETAIADYLYARLCQLEAEVELLRDEVERGRRELAEDRQRWSRLEVRQSRVEAAVFPGDSTEGDR